VGASYHVVLPTQDVLRSLAEMDLFFQLPSGTSRFPTISEIHAVLDNLEGCTARYQVFPERWEANIEETDRNAGLSHSDLLGHGEPTSDTQLEFFFEKGSLDLHLRILVGLAQHTGPLLLVTSYMDAFMALPDSVHEPLDDSDPVALSYLRQRPMSVVELVGWKDSFGTEPLTTLIQDDAGYELDEAQKCSDDLVEGMRVRVEFDDEKRAREFLERATALGAVGQLLRRSAGQCL
jgi:hypothetical protein